MLSFIHLRETSISKRDSLRHPQTKSYFVPKKAVRAGRRSPIVPWLHSLPSLETAALAVQGATHAPTHTPQVQGTHLPAKQRLGKSHSNWL